MPLGLLKYGFAGKYPAGPDLPPSKDLKPSYDVIIIGGGGHGLAIAYHLAKIGWSDVVLLERKKLTSGTTWHAAGLIGQLRDIQDMTKLAKYTAELYLGLADETGQDTG